MKQLVLATHNRDKAREFALLLEDLGVEVLTLDAYPQIGAIAEEEESLDGNARVKAVAVLRQTGLPSLADDTGLEVHYLNGAPGVYSSRYAGEGVSYAENVRKLLADLRGVPPRRRAARFRCVLAFAAPGRKPQTAQGVTHGVILEVPCGHLGFGYDPVFLPEGETQTYAQMDAVQKNRVSHRGRAIEQMRPILEEYFKKG